MGSMGSAAPSAPFQNSFNSGVLLLRLSVLRATRFEQTIWELIDRYGVTEDQLLLNLVCAGRQAPLPARFNVPVAPTMLARWSVTGVDATVLHYAGPYKPWRPLHPECNRSRPCLRSHALWWRMQERWKAVERATVARAVQQQPRAV